MAVEKTRRAHPDTLDEDISTTGSEEIGPSLPRFDSDLTVSGAAVADYPSKKASAAKGGKSLQTEAGTSAPNKVRMPPTGPARKRV